MESIVDPPPDGKTDRPDELKPGDIVLVDLEHGSMIGEALIVGAIHVYVADGNGTCEWYSRSAVSEYVEPEDPEEFCSDCLAGMESSEHHEKCVVQRDDCDPYCMVPFGAHHPRCAVRR